MSTVVRVEKRLNRLDGVTATVNFATETGTATVPAGTPATDLVAAVEAAASPSPLVVVSSAGHIGHGTRSVQCHALEEPTVAETTTNAR